MNAGSFLRTLVLVVLSMACGRFVRENPLLFGYKATAAFMPFTIAISLSTEHQQCDVDDKKNVTAATSSIIITSHPVLDAVLRHHEADIVGEGDYEAYRNHW
jgi:hypothetical protein